jgi:hypothetical protein
MKSGWKLRLCMQCRSPPAPLFPSLAVPCAHLSPLSSTLIPALNKRNERSPASQKPGCGGWEWTSDSSCCGVYREAEVTGGRLLCSGTRDPVGFVCGWEYCMDGKDCGVAVGRVVAGFTGQWSGIILNPTRIHAPMVQWFWWKRDKLPPVGRINRQGPGFSALDVKDNQRPD